MARIIGIGARSGPTASSLRIRVSQPPRTASSASWRMRSRATRRRPSGPASKVQSMRALVRAEMGLDRLDLARGQDRALELQDPGLARVLVVDVAEIAEAGLQAHHPPFAQRVDRRVGDLAELLAEEVVQAAIVPGEHGQRRVVAHRAHRLLGVEHHGREDQLHVLDGEAVERLAAAQLGALVGGGRERPRLRALVEMGDVLHPAAVGLERRPDGP